MTEKQYKESGKAPEITFSSLLSDEKLKKDVLALTFENPDDKSAVNSILAHKEGLLTDAQRTWFSILLTRKGARFK